MKFDVIIIGGGKSGMAKATELQKAGRKCAVVSKGRSLYGPETDEYTKAGGCLLMGDEVTGYTLSGNTLKEVFTKNLQEVSLQAPEFYLATGKFFAGGLVANMDSLYEPIFGLDVKYEQDRSKWFAEHFADEQPFMKFGVVTSENGCALRGGNEIVNLFPIGEIKAE